MIAKYTVLSNIISIVSDNIWRIRIQESLLVSKKLQFFFILYQHIAAYSSAIKFTSPIQICVQAEGYSEAYENFSIDPAPCRKNPIKK